MFTSLRRETRPTASDGLDRHPTIKDVVFAHIPKTAGTSVRNMLAEALPDAIHVFDYGANTAAIGGHFVNAFTSDARTPEGLIALRSQFERNKRLFVSGHLPVRRYLAAFHPASFITFLRNPLDRVVSAYRHHVDHLNFGGSLADFCELPGQVNTQSRVLRAIRLQDMGFVGLTEFMPDMLPALSRHLGVNLALRKDNVGSRFGRPKLEDAVCARIMALNEQDMELYRQVEANLDYFTNYRGRSATGLAQAKGRVNWRGDGTFRGWAKASPPNRLVEIEVRIGMQTVHRCYADQFMASMTNRLPSGVGGFSMQLPESALAGQKQVRFLIAGTEKDLNGSPVML